MIEVLTDNHYQAITTLFSTAKKSIRIISQFLTDSMAAPLYDTVAQKNHFCTFVTRFYINGIFYRSNYVLEK